MFVCGMVCVFCVVYVCKFVWFVFMCVLCVWWLYVCVWWVYLLCGVWRVMCVGYGVCGVFMCV